MFNISSRQSIIARLLWSNGLVLCVFFLMFFLTIIAFGLVDRRAILPFQRHLDLVLTNAELSRDLLHILEHVNQTMQTFYGNDSALRRDGDSALEKMAELNARRDIPMFANDMRLFHAALAAVLEQCQQVNAARAEIERSDANLMEQLNALDEMITDHIIEQKLSGKDVVGLEQLSNQLPDFRETVLNIRNQFAQAGLAYFEQPQAPAETHPMLSALAALHMQFQSLGAYDAALLDSTKQLIATTQQYESAILTFHEQAAQFGQRTLALNHARDALSRLLEQQNFNIRAMASSTSRRARLWIGIAIATAIAGFLLMLPALILNTRTARSLAEPIRSSIEQIHCIAHGSLPETIRMTHKGEFQKVEENLSLLNDLLKRLLQETSNFIEAVRQGNLQIEQPARSFSGQWQTLFFGLRAMLDAFRIPISGTADALQRLAHGDLTGGIVDDYPGDYNTIKQAANHLNTQLQDVVHLVQLAANEILQRSDDVRSRAQIMTKGAEQQAAASEQTSEDTNRIVTQIAENAAYAKETYRLAFEVAEFAERFGQVAVETAASLNAISSQTAMIENIAGQTRMLSLNATIEAARAQERGQAFSVVATEVRRLSDITKHAAEDITRAVAVGLANAEQSSQMLTTLLPRIQKTAELVQRISAASDEQLQRVESVNHTMRELDSVIRQNVATAANLTTTATDLAKQAEQLQQTMRFFTICCDSSA